METTIMMTATVPSELYQGSGWACAAIVDGKVIALRYGPDGAAAEGEAGYMAAAAEVDALKADPIVQAAETAANAAWNAIDTLEADEQEAAEARACAISLTIRVGMCGGTEFHHTFDKAEERKLGLPKRR